MFHLYTKYNIPSSDSYQHQMESQIQIFRNHDILVLRSTKVRLTKGTHSGKIFQDYAMHLNGVVLS
jgi:hypothetical protein